MLRILIFIAVPLAALLTFLVQPITGKYLLPWHGGSASTWISSMVFFQTALLLGYGLAYSLQRLPYRKQIWIMMFIAAAGFILLQLPLLKLQGSYRVSGVFLSLALSLLPTLLLTSSIGIVLHGWLRQLRGDVPYYLYSLSNAGSLIALCVYPFVVEPSIGLSTQSSVFHALVGVLVIVVLALAAGLLRTKAEWLEHVPATTHTSEQIAIGTKLYWLLLSAAGCAAMISVMRLLSGELGSNPISWILPLGIYLMSFILTFSGSWRGRYNTVLGLVLLGLILFYVNGHGFLLHSPNRVSLLLILLALIAGTHVAHGLVYLRRPKENFATFYLFLAMGGVVGGIFTSLIAPNAWGRSWELAGTFMLIIALAIAEATRNLPTWRRWSWSVICILPVLGILLSQIYEQSSGGNKIQVMRNVYGQFTIVTKDGMQRCLSETTLHGLQFLDAERNLMPTAYYHRGSGVGMVMQAVQQDKASVQVGVVGLGVGTLATYGRAGDKFIFWDINPLTFQIARDFFGFVPNSAADIEFRWRDGRLGLEEAEEDFDLLVIDAFSGDGIPFHLITREAIRTALDRVPQGYLIIHTSNRYVDLFPVLAAHARAFGKGCLRITMDPSVLLTDKEAAYGSIYVLFYPEGKVDETVKWLSPLVHRGAVYTLEHDLNIPDADLIHWFDDRYAILDVLKMD